MKEPKAAQNDSPPLFEIALDITSTRSNKKVEVKYCQSLIG